ncbi:MAG: hypothetical protein ACI906_005005 [Candidatus Latescibacterota bacterium]|jgi:hypothetical protein
MTPIFFLVINLSLFLKNYKQSNLAPKVTLSK